MHVPNRDRRDAERLRELLAWARASLGIDEPEALLLLDATNGAAFVAATAPLALQSEVADTIRFSDL